MTRGTDLAKARREVRASRARAERSGNGRLPPGPAGSRGPRPPLSPLAATRACLARSFVFSARARRDEYWGFTAVASAALAAVAAADWALPHGAPAGGPTAAFAALLAPASLAAGWRRMHDIDRAGWVSILHVLVFAGGGLGAFAAAVAAGEGQGPADGETSFFAAFAATAAASLVAWFFVVTRLLRSTWPRNNRWGKTPNV
ncbi:MAG: DUF805 domain-containing protein [Pseudomonadota bacterium]